MVLFSGCPGEAVVLFEIQNPAGSLGTSKKRRRLGAGYWESLAELAVTCGNTAGILAQESHI